MIYSATYGASGSASLTNQLTPEEGASLPPAIEPFAYFLGDIDQESKDHGVTSNRTDKNGNPEAKADLNAKDSTFILIYSAMTGAGNTPEWGKDVIVENLPKYTAEITAWVKANPDAAVQPTSEESAQ